MSGDGSNTLDQTLSLWRCAVHELLCTTYTVKTDRISISDEAREGSFDGGDLGVPATICIQSVCVVVSVPHCERRRFLPERFEVSEQDEPSNLHSGCHHVSIDKAKWPWSVFCDVQVDKTIIHFHFTTQQGSFPGTWSWPSSNFWKMVLLFLNQTCVCFLMKQSEKKGAKACCKTTAFQPQATVSATMYYGFLSWKCIRVQCQLSQTTTFFWVPRGQEHFEAPALLNGTT